MTTRRNPASTRRGKSPGRRAEDRISSVGAAAAALIDAVCSQNELFYEAAKRANERSQRLAAAAFDDIQSAQRDALRLLQRWAESPFDLLGVYTGVVDASIGARVRVAQSFARWQHEFSQARTEAAEAVRRSVQLSRAANENGAATRTALARKNGHS